jgi:hypothetical protein
MPGGSTPCRYLAEGGGCGIYDRRPATCAEWFCEWRYGLGDAADRPDRIGAVPHTGGPYGPRAIRLAMSPGRKVTEATRAFLQRLCRANLRVVWVKFTKASDDPNEPALVARAQVPRTDGR